MAISATVSSSIQVSNQTSAIVGSQVVTDGLLLQLSNTIAVSANETDAFAFDKTKLKAFFAVADVNCTMTPVRAGPANETAISLVAGVPYVWTNGYFAVPFANNITSFNFANPDANNTCNVSVMAIVDPT